MAEIGGVVGVKESTGSQMECHIEASETATASSSVSPRHRRSSLSHLLHFFISSFSASLQLLLCYKQPGKGVGGVTEKWH
jgi:hypothetical protein